MNNKMKFLMLACLSAILAVAAQAQAPAKLKLEKIHEDQWAQYSINPGETKEVAVVEVGIAGSLHIYSSLQGKFDKWGADSGTKIPDGIFGSTGKYANIPYTGSVVAPNGTLIGACGVCRTESFDEMTTWTLKKDGNQINNGNDEIRRTFISQSMQTKFKNDGNRAGEITPGTYSIAIKCNADSPCKSWLSIYLDPPGMSDPNNLMP